MPLKKKRKGYSWGGPWRFDRSLLVLSEPASIGDIKDQSFTHTSFWVQVHNIHIMCINKDAIQKLGEKIGTMQEIEIDETGECIGQFACVRIFIDITREILIQFFLLLMWFIVNKICLFIG